jgi:5-aminolevulinate synthase
VHEFRNHLVEALDCIWTQLGIKRTSDWSAESGLFGIGQNHQKINEPLWSDAQLGLQDFAVDAKASATVNILEDILGDERTEGAQAMSTA